MGNGRMTITDVADRIGVTPKTIIRWEKSGKVTKPKRDWRLWRVYNKEDFKKLKAFKETVIYSLFIMSLFLSSAMAEDKPLAASETTPQVTTTTATPTTPTPVVAATPVAAKPATLVTTTTDKTPEKEGYTLALPSNIAVHEAKVPIIENSDLESVKYTLGPDDVIEIAVMRHPEFSGTFPISSEGKIQYKFVGDIDVRGLTKKQVEEKLAKILSNYIIDPEINVTITEFKSKFIFVLGEVSQPGKYYIKSESITVRDAVVTSGLPTTAAAMRKCSLITPDKSGKAKNKPVNIYEILYAGDLRKNIEMYPGDVLYVPSTVMAKVIRVISPVATTVGLASSSTDGSSTVKTGAKTMMK